MDRDGFGRLRAYLDGVSGGSCTLPFERMRELTGEPLPEAATSEAWWTDQAGWDAWQQGGNLGVVGQRARWRREHQVFAAEAQCASLTSAQPGGPQEAA